MFQPNHISSELAAVDRLLIDEEHARLEQFLNDLCDTCDNFSAQGECYGCSRAQVATCQGRLASFFYDFLDLVAEHFEHEETIMRGIMTTTEDERHFLLHQAEHARLMSEVKSLMRESSAISRQGNPSEAMRRLDRMIAEMFGVHAHIFDVPFLQAMQGKGKASGHAGQGRGHGYDRLGNTNDSLDSSQPQRTQRAPR